MEPEPTLARYGIAKEQKEKFSRMSKAIGNFLHEKTLYYSRPSPSILSRKGPNGLCDKIHILGNQRIQITKYMI
jgi:hypothetical protein